jgi:hypothetical protein
MLQARCYAIVINSQHLKIQLDTSSLQADVDSAVEKLANTATQVSFCAKRTTDVHHIMALLQDPEVFVSSPEKGTYLKLRLLNQALNQICIKTYDGTPLLDGVSVHQDNFTTEQRRMMSSPAFCSLADIQATSTPPVIRIGKQNNLRAILAFMRQTLTPEELSDGNTSIAVLLLLSRGESHAQLEAVRAKLQTNRHAQDAEITAWKQREKEYDLQIVLATNNPTVKLAQNTLAQLKEKQKHIRLEQDFKLQELQIRANESQLNRNAESQKLVQIIEGHKAAGETIKLLAGKEKADAKRRVEAQQRQEDNAKFQVDESARRLTEMQQQEAMENRRREANERTAIQEHARRTAEAEQLSTLKNECAEKENARIVAQNLAQHKQCLAELEHEHKLRADEHQKSLDCSKGPRATKKKRQRTSHTSTVISKKRKTRTQSHKKNAADVGRGSKASARSPDAENLPSPVSPMLLACQSSLLSQVGSPAANNAPPPTTTRFVHRTRKSARKKHVKLEPSPSVPPLLQPRVRNPKVYAPHVERQVAFQKQMASASFTTQECQHCAIPVDESTVNITKIGGKTRFLCSGCADNPLLERKVPIFDLRERGRAWFLEYRAANSNMASCILCKRDMSFFAGNLMMEGDVSVLVCNQCTKFATGCTSMSTAHLKMKEILLRVNSVHKSSHKLFSIAGRCLITQKSNGYLSITPIGNQQPSIEVSGCFQRIRFGTGSSERVCESLTPAVHKFSMNIRGLGKLYKDILARIPLY